MPDNKVYWVWLSVTFGAGSTRVLKLCNRYSFDAKAIFDASSDIDKELLPKSDSILKRLREKDLDLPFRICEYCQKYNIEIITPEDDIFPEKLKEIPSMPAVLYSQGDFPDFNSSLAVGMVGVRDASSYGEKNAKTISFDLSSAGAIVVSGMARGIDSYSHIGAIEAGGRTVAVTGCGIDICYPPENEDLRSEIIKNDGVVVIEATYSSGSLITADLAIKQGRPLFALPGNVGSQNSIGTNDLLKRGAAAITCAEDILSSFEDKAAFLHPEMMRSHMAKTPGPIEGKQKQKRKDSREK